MHQWRFESVEKSAFFPHSCKTSYKAYSSDQVIELQIKEKNQLSDIGRLTGLEPITVLIICFDAIPLYIGLTQFLA